MANTYSQVSIHCVFAVKGRENLIVKDFRDRLHTYIAGTLKGEGAYALAVGGWLDHVHVFYELPMTTAIADLMRAIKAGSSKWINDNKLVPGKFQWQEGFGAFSYSISHIDRVVKYILNQKEHHKKQTFKQEYIESLNEYDIEFKEEYLFEFLDISAK